MIEMKKNTSPSHGGAVNYKNYETKENESIKYSGKPIAIKTSSSGKSQSRIQKSSKKRTRKKTGKNIPALSAAIHL